MKTAMKRPATVQEALLAIAAIQPEINKAYPNVKIDLCAAQALLVTFTSGRSARIMVTDDMILVVPYPDRRPMSVFMSDLTLEDYGAIWSDKVEKAMSAATGGWPLQDV